jgi:hypothetical protein
MSHAMANAMLQVDFKSSHQDLGNVSNESDSSGNLKSQVNDTSSSLKDPSASPAKQKSVDFAILPPPKRARLGPPLLTAKQVVEGTLPFCDLEEAMIDHSFL